MLEKMNEMNAVSEDALEKVTGGKGGFDEYLYDDSKDYQIIVTCPVCGFQTITSASNYFDFGAYRNCPNCSAELNKERWS